MTGTEHALAMVPYACCYSPPHQVSMDEIYSKKQFRMLIQKRKPNSMFHNLRLHYL